MKIMGTDICPRRCGWKPDARMVWIGQWDQDCRAQGRKWSCLSLSAGLRWLSHVGYSCPSGLVCHHVLLIGLAQLTVTMILDWLTETWFIIGGLVSRSATAPPLTLENACLAAYSYLDENTPIAYHYEQPQCMMTVGYFGFACTNIPYLYSDRFPYTNETYNNPQNLWTFASVSLFTTFSKVLLIEVSAKRHFSVTSRPGVPFFGLLIIRKYGKVKSH